MNRTRTLVLTVTVLAASLAIGASAGSASAATTWLCSPTLSAATNPCVTKQSTSTVLSNNSRSISSVSVPSNPKVDCFYVYPTTSDQQTLVANFAITPELKSIALFQAAPYNRICKVYAPVYRQMTIYGLNHRNELTQPLADQAYNDVKSAWNDYLAHYNKGRGVILIGHSQGSFTLRRLIKAEIDPKLTVRKKIVAAHLIGGNVLVAKGSDRGGDFQNIPACKKSTQTRCVIGYSTFNQTVPTESMWGRAVATGLGPDVNPATEEVLCTNPANLAGGSGNLTTIVPSAPFAPLSSIGLGIGLLGMGLPKAVTSHWIQLPDLYSGRCVTSNGAKVLMVTGRTSKTPLNAVPSADWGLHLADMNIAMGNLLTVAKAQAAAYK